MNSDNFSQFFSKKAYEIGRAACKIGLVVKIQSFGDHLFDQAFLLLDLAGRGRYLECRDITESMEYLLILGGDVGIVHSGNIETMAGEIRQFNSAIAEYEKLVEQPAFVDFEGSFSGMPAVSENKNGDSLNADFLEIHNQKTSYNPDFLASHELQKENVNGVGKSAMRQSAILGIIRQNSNLPGHQGGCRLKDIQDFLRDVSERTIRYDLQGLIQHGFIERIGSGGPATHYRIRQGKEKEEILHQRPE